MAGFLDPKERVIDMVLTDTGKQLLMKGELRFVYWIPFDDEVDYSSNLEMVSGTYNNLDQTWQERRQELLETPLISEATMGYRGLNLVEEDFTNVHRPMYTAGPGVGHTSPLPQMTVDVDALPVEVSQKKLTKTYVQKDNAGNIIGGQVGPIQVGFQRFNPSEAKLDASYSTGSYTNDSQLEGFLVTMYQSSTLVQKAVGNGLWADTYNISGSGGYQEILHNRDSNGNIVYRNDISLKIENT